MKKILFVAGLAAVASASQATLYTFDSGVVSIPDLSPATTVTYNVGVLDGPVVSVELMMTGFAHSFPDDTGALLVDAAGNGLVLFDGPGDTAETASFNWLFSDSGTGTLPNTGALASGTFKPNQNQFNDVFTNGGTFTAVTTFAGMTGTTGAWSLYIEDFVGGDSGSLQNAQLRITTNPVPEPATMVGLGVVALAALRRRKK